MASRAEEGCAFCDSCNGREKAQAYDPAEEAGPNGTMSKMQNDAYRLSKQCPRAC